MIHVKYVPLAWLGMSNLEESIKYIYFLCSAVTNLFY